MILKTLLSVLIILLFNSIISAQKLQVGVGAGVCYFNQKFNNPFANSKVVLDEEGLFPAIGIFGLYSFTKHFSLMAEISYQRKGLSYNDPGAIYDMNNKLQNQDNEYSNRLNYLQLDLLPRFSIGNKTKFYLQAGPYAAILLRADHYVWDEYYDYNAQPPYIGDGSLETQNNLRSVDDRTDNVTAAYNPIDIGLAGGVGVTKGRFGVDYRYSNSLMNTYKKAALYSGYNQVHTLKITFVFLRSKIKEEVSTK